KSLSCTLAVIALLII
ncbi:hypothetical protein, partial [Pseudomonas aeruginosa]